MNLEPLSFPEIAIELIKKALRSIDGISFQENPRARENQQSDEPQDVPRDDEGPE